MRPTRRRPRSPARRYVDGGAPIVVAVRPFCPFHAAVLHSLRWEPGRAICPGGTGGGPMRNKVMSVSAPDRGRRRALWYAAGVLAATALGVQAAPAFAVDRPLAAARPGDVQARSAPSTVDATVDGDMAAVTITWTLPDENTAELG